MRKWTIFVYIKKNPGYISKSKFRFRGKNEKGEKQKGENCTKHGIKASKLLFGNAQHAYCQYLSSIYLNQHWFCFETLRERYVFKEESFDATLNTERGKVVIFLINDLGRRKFNTLQTSTDLNKKKSNFTNESYLTKALGAVR